MRNIFCDLHIHIGSACSRPVKITASRKLDLETIIFHDALRKGLDIVGVVDCASPPVIKEIKGMLDEGRLSEHRNGGFLAENGVMLIAGAEVETREGIHVITYFPNLSSIEKYQKFIKTRVTNVELSTQRANAGIIDFINLAHLCDGIFCFAHAFTPHKGVYGMLTDRLDKILGNDIKQVKVIELGLSSDTNMADMIAETRDFTFLSNSDAHSSANIAREYNLLRVAEKSFKEVKLALENEGERRVIANYGMDPLMGKYHRSYCNKCEFIIEGEPPIFTCPKCGNIQNIVKGVYDRIVEIRDYPEPHHPIGRPKYNYRVPLKDLPGVGPKTLSKLTKAFYSEIEILEQASVDDLTKIVGIDIATMIGKMRSGRLSIIPGGGGYYGKVKKDSRN
ncbi:MAG TPA: endonuclease Q family protein [Syntrophomonadaceae bacterium]|nr:endonuclease Q family protein [Syntrophomonadaceae bacterium]